MYKALRGMKDLLPEEAEISQEIERKARLVFKLYGYKPIRTPLLEDVQLFVRSLGGDSEIVEKQMFVIKRQKDMLCLRPEATCGIVRAYLEHHLERYSLPVKLYYIGPMFRAERPQKGRLRQFSHIGAEAIGEDSPYLDAEIIALSQEILRETGINGFTTRINTLGCIEDKKGFADLLRKALKNKLGLLCPRCKNRFQRNVFRILDCKNKSCRRIIQGLKIEHKDYLCRGCVEHFKKTKEALEAIGARFEVAPYLVRGLDYYTRTVFEIIHPDLGSQDALGAGGRYDNLIEELGGERRGAIGFALGLERLILVRNPQFITHSLKPTVYIAALTRGAKKEGFILLNSLRKAGISSDMDYAEKSLKSQMRQANRTGARFVALLGEDELKKGIVNLKDMASGEQVEIKIERFVEEIKSK